jgi:Ribonuclease G/E
VSRRLYLDAAPGETRGVVALDGAPERLLIERATDLPHHRPGARLAARVRRMDKPLATAFLDVGQEPDAVLPLVGAAARLAEGARIEVEVVSPPRRGKGAVVRLLGPWEGEPRLLEPATALIDRLRAFAPGAEVDQGRTAREAAEVAETAALAAFHRLPSGGSIWIEPTRALVAIDVNIGSAHGDGRRAAGRANCEAIAAAARLLRLKALGGPVVIDFAGKGQDGEALKLAATAAFAPDQPGAAFGAITRFGLWPLVLPHRAAPVAEILCTDDGAFTDQTLVFRLLREIESAAEAGLRIEARAAPEIAAAAAVMTPYLMERIGPRFRIVADAGAPRDAPTLRPWEDRDDG